MGYPNDFIKLGWSISKDDEFRSCKRKYFYKRYASWWGWPTAPPRNEFAKQCYFLKNVKSISAWRGIVVHKALGRLLQGVYTPYNIIEKTEAYATVLWDQAVRNYESDHSTLNPANNLLFIEHLREGVNQEDLADTLYIASESIQAVIDNGLHELFSAARDKNLFSYVETEYGDDKNSQNAQFARMHIKLKTPKTKEPVTVHTRADCAVEVCEGLFYVFDWKIKSAISNAEQKSRQVRLYAEWLRQDLVNAGKRVDRIEAYEAYLPDYELQGGVISNSEIDQTLQAAKQDIDELYDLHLQLVNEDNAPGNDEDGLAICPSEPSGLCKVCEFNTICEAGKEFLSS